MTLPFYNRYPAFLRTDLPSLCSDTHTFPDGSTAQIKRLSNINLVNVAKFLENYYCGDDWRIRRVESWIGRYLCDVEVVVLGLLKGETLIATIFSVPVGGSTFMSHGGLVRNMRVIEGLCVAPQYRSHGIAGFMIRHADIFTSYTFGVCAHLWARELDLAPFFHTALTIDKYGYTKTARSGSSDPNIKTMSWGEFVEHWTSNSNKWVIDADEPCIVALEPQNRRERNMVFYGYRGLMVISHSERTSVDGHKHIYEIVWSGRFDKDGLMPARRDFNFKQLADGIATLLPTGGVLFGTSSPCCGGVSKDWDGWIVGNSGYHGLYLYNYMPPAFGACRIHIVRDEL